MTKKPANLILFEAKPEQRELLSLLVAYLRKNPPTLAHGFSHFVKTARNAYRLALSNNADLVELAWVCGILHDVYRPAEGKAGQEDHETQTAKIAGEILSKSSYHPIRDKVVETLRERDPMILENRAGMIAKIVSLADKTDMSLQRLVAYTWASNKTLSRSGTLAYSSYIETMKDFSAYQTKAWKIFLLTREIKGVIPAINAYLKTNQDLLKAVRQEINGKINYQEESLILTKKEARLEKETMQEFKFSSSVISDFTKNFRELL